MDKARKHHAKQKADTTGYIWYNSISVKTAEQASPWKQKAEKHCRGLEEQRGRRLLMGTRAFLPFFFFYRDDENVLELDSGDSCRALSIY